MIFTGAPAGPHAAPSPTRFVAASGVLFALRSQDDNAGDD